ncbi:DDE-type integrase/transposase/recombinase [Butyrivibrio sp. AC2005]|uniref:DDE-type integrase/transposase/recombinase n=1 Tax=Butyrivibrio sp. AC2005 TaxID=1280672 RepID=UPI0004242904|nr:DDE-type integrase/transposase/recombinase [Butyrivibrio sp. AC2005]
MNKGLYRKDEIIIRVLAQNGEKVLVMDCIRFTMPIWEEQMKYRDYFSCDIKELYIAQGLVAEDIDAVNAERRRIMYQRYSVIAGILPFIEDISRRGELIEISSERYNLSQKTLRSYLCHYLAFNEISALLPKKQKLPVELTEKEKHMRWALNKFFYNGKKNSLKSAYKQMIKAKYCNEDGMLVEEYPTFYQFRYFYRKTKNMQNYYISRGGLSDYQRNKRPLLGDGVQSYAPAPGVAMVDGTVCDIYLVNEAGQLIGRPILLAIVDAYSYMCYGYTLAWEGGIYAVRTLIMNVLKDKAEICAKNGIIIEKEVWPNKGYLPGVIMADQGSEYVGETFSQLSELGVTIENLPAYRPELKGVVEKFFDLIQSKYKPILKGKGVIEPDFRSRGAHDYRKDACLTLDDFNKIILRCIFHYNAEWLIEGFPMTEDMIQEGIKPYASQLFKWGNTLSGVNLIKNIHVEEALLCLLPRTMGRFTREGLKVNSLRYYCDGYTERYLKGGEVTVAYSDDVSVCWLYEKGQYTRFSLIESRFVGMDIKRVQELKESQKTIIQKERTANLQSDIELVRHIEAIASLKSTGNKASIKDIRENRIREQKHTHIDFAREEGLYDEY